MMTDSEIAGAIEDLRALTERGLRWVARDGDTVLETDDVPGFAASIRVGPDGVRLQIDDDSGPVAIVGPDDGRTVANRSKLEGAAYSLFALAKPTAGTSDSARWSQAVQKLHAQPLPDNGP